MWILEVVKSRPDLAAIVVLLLVMLIDTLLALLVAGSDGEITSTEMHKGVTKKLGTILIVLGVQFIALLMPELVGGQPAGALAASAYIVVELVSVAGHMATLGIGIPAPLRGIFQPHGEKAA